MTKRVHRDDAIIGNRMRALRLQAGLSQVALVSACGLSFQQIQKYECGDNRISGTRIITICKLLNTDPNTLLGWNSEQAATGLHFSASAYRLALELERLDRGLQPCLLTFVSGLIDHEEKRRQRRNGRVNIAIRPDHDTTMR